MFAESRREGPTATSELTTHVIDRRAVETRRRLAYAVVRSGTSLLHVFREDEFPNVSDGDVPLFPVLKTPYNPTGSAADHYQDNKIALISPRSGAHFLAFRHLQIVGRTCQQLLSLECSNAAAASAVYALMAGLVYTDHNGTIRCLNKATRQRSELEPILDVNSWKGSCKIRFIQEGFSEDVLDQEQTNAIRADGSVVPISVLYRGNVFVLLNIDPHLMEPAIVSMALQKARSTVRWAAAGKQLSDSPKVMLYFVSRSHKSEYWCNSACFYRDMRHRSLPGSGAMALAGFLALNVLRETRPLEPFGQLTYHLRHQSGVMSVGVNWEVGANGFRVVTTEFVTPVQVVYCSVLP